MHDHTPPSKSHDVHEHGTLGQGGDTRRGDFDAAARSRHTDPDARASAPDARDTNHDHPDAPGTRQSHPGEGLTGPAGDIGAGSTQPSQDAPSIAPGGKPIAAPAPQAAAADAGLRDRLKDGVNRVEDQTPGDSPRLSIPSDQLGPTGGHTHTPELSDPNYTAASEASRRS